MLSMYDLTVALECTRVRLEIWLFLGRIRDKGILFAGDFLNLNGATREADGNGLQFIEYAFSSQS